MSTTSEEVWQMLRELVRSQQDTDRQLKETDRLVKETEQQLRETEQYLKEFAQRTDRRIQENDQYLKEFAQETDRRIQENDQYLKEFAQETDCRMQETDRRMQETDRRMQETDRRMQETDRRMQETDRQIKELGKQIGGLGAKFGSFTEGLALPSMDRILRQQFGMEYVSPRARKRRHGEEIEIDVLAYANSDRQAVYVVEVKSHPREETIVQMKRLLKRFRQFFPEHQDKALYGILAAVSLPEDLRQRLLAEGLYVAQIDDEVFRLDVPEGFEGRAWN